MLDDLPAPVAASAFNIPHSFSGRRWIMRDAPERALRALLLEGSRVPPSIARLLAARNVRPEDLDDLLKPTLRRLLPEPHSLLDMEKAVGRVRAALDRNEKIAAFGDYDVDGSVSAALLSDFFGALGRQIRLYIPDRMTEGYGPNIAAMQRLRAEGAAVVITVDCGASAHSALGAARDAGLDVIVLDHHAADRTVPAFAHVNPNAVGDASGLGHLCAAGVTFLFLVALNRALRESGWYVANKIAEPDLRDGLDIVALATICDVVPLVGVNRAFARAGLTKMAELGRPGLAALASISRIDAPYNPHHCGFVLGPRINAGGRVGKCSLGVGLLTAKDRTTADAIAALLDMHNRERQAIEKLILDEAIAHAATQTNAPFLFAHGEGWHPGVVGIVASRLKDRFGKPVFAAGFEGGLGRGSARSVAGVDIGAIVREAHARKLIDSGGGHAMAAGFSLRADQLEPFATFLAGQFDGHSQAIAAASDLYLDAVVAPSGVTQALIGDVARIGPFGAGNPEPIFVVPDARIAFADRVGKHHIRLRLVGGDGAALSAIAFRSAETPLGEALLKSRGARIHAAGRLRAEAWNGERRVQLHLEDAAPSGA